MPYYHLFFYLNKKRYTNIIVYDCYLLSNVNILRLLYIIKLNTVLSILRRLVSVNDSLADHYNIKLEKCPECGAIPLLYEQNRNCEGIGITLYYIKCKCGHRSQSYSDLGKTPEDTILLAMDCFRGYTLDRG